MPRRSQPGSFDEIKAKLVEAVEGAKAPTEANSLRDSVQHLAEATHRIRDLGASLMPLRGRSSGKKRILEYLKMHVGEIIHSSELMVVSGIGDYPRRIRELRIESGWPVDSGYARTELREALIEDGVTEDELPPPMKPEEYLLREAQRDKAVAERWKTANTIRKSRDGVQKKILQFFQANVGVPISSEELRYVAKDATEWARRTRELRTEEGWPIMTYYSGDRSLRVGDYVLAENRQAPPHDRHISEKVRRQVMKRDHYSCRARDCGWPAGHDLEYDKRFLEAHHIDHHADGGSNKAENLVTLCNLCHDEVHRTNKLDIVPV